MATNLLIHTLNSAIKKTQQPYNYNMSEKIKWVVQPGKHVPRQSEGLHSASPLCNWTGLFFFVLPGKNQMLATLLSTAHCMYNKIVR